jgi:hypothetical protein
MANESPRLTTADLRRRLLGGVVAPTPVPAAPARPADPRLAVPASVADLPIDEDAPTLNFGTGDEEASILPTALPVPVPRTPIPASPIARVAAAEVLRPISKGSDHHSRPVLHPPTAQPIYERAVVLLDEPAKSPADAVADVLRAENDQLRQLMEEMRQLLQDASDQEQRVQAELAERDRLLADARDKAEALEAQLNNKPKTRGELEEWSDELEQEAAKIAQGRRDLDAERQQLREDEVSLEKQMRDMEVQMARERAMLARQEQELKRLNAEIQHELEVMQQGGGTLRDRLAVFQRKHAEVVGGIRPGSNSNMNLPMAEAVTPAPPRKSENGLWRKMFGGE